MSREIPEGWQQARVSDVLEKVSQHRSRKLPTKDYQESGAIPIVDQGESIVCGYTDDANAVCSVPLPVIVFGDHTRYFKYIDFPFAIGADGTQLLKPVYSLDPKFFFYALKNLELPSEGYSRHFRYLKEKFISFPPLDEQRRIANILSSVDEAIQATQTVIKQTRTVKQGVLQRLLTRGIGHTRFKQTQIGEIPEDWEVCRIDQIGDVQSGRQRSPHFTEGEPRPYLRVANVFDGFIDSRDLLTMKFTDGEFERFKLKPGDILLNEGQSLELVGRNAVYEGQPANCCFQNTLLRFRAGPETSPRFAYALMQRLYQEGRFSEIATQTTSVAHLGGRRFAALMVGLPPMTEQLMIAELHDAMIAAERVEVEKLSSFVRCKSALMSDLLTGRKRVSSDLLMAAE
jgi:type I restriction enzyme S subunit